MNNEKNSDHLEELFRCHLAGHEEDPPDEVWQAICPRLKQKNRQKGGWLVGLLLLAGLGAGLVFWENGQERRLQKLEEQLAERTVLMENSAETKAPGEQKPSFETPLANEAETSQIIDNQTTRQKEASRFFTKKTTQPTDDTSAGSTPFTVSGSAPFTAQVAPSAVNGGHPDTVNGVLPVPNLETLPGRGIFWVERKSPARPQLHLEAAAPPKFRPAFEVYFNTAFVFSQNHLAKTSSGIIPDLGYRWSAGALVELAATKHWSLLTGFDYGVLAPIAYDEKVFQWNEATAVTLPDGSIVNHVHFEAATALGKTFVNARVKKNTDNVITGDAYAVRVVTQPKVALLTMPLVVKFRLSRGRFSAFLKAGAGSSFVRSRQVNLLKISVAHSEQWSVPEAETGEELLEMERHFLQGYLGFGAAYRFDRRFSLLAEPTWSFSFSPLNQRYGQDIRPQALGLQVAGRVDF